MFGRVQKKKLKDKKPKIPEILPPSILLTETKKEESKKKGKEEKRVVFDLPGEYPLVPSREYVLSLTTYTLFFTPLHC